MPGCFALILVVLDETLRHLVPLMKLVRRVMEVLGAASVVWWWSCGLDLVSVIAPHRVFLHLLRVDA
jgi:hypothetical protein